MAYRRKPQPQPPSEHQHPQPVSPSSPSQESLAAQAMRASAAHRDASSLSSAYSSSAASAAAAARRSHEPSVSTPAPDSSSYGYTSMKSLNEDKYGFWGTLARKAKSFIDEDGSPGQYDSPERQQPPRHGPSPGIQIPHSADTWKSDTPPSQKRSEVLASSLNYIGGTIKSALEEGRTIVENKTADIIQETRKLNIRRKGSSGLNPQGEASHKFAHRNFLQNPLDHETQLKASRDVANAMSAKAKLLLRELKTVKADLAFAKERCAQLEDENKMLRESQDNGDNPEDDDLIRLQLETLLAEKARLAHENSVYARENRFLREIVEYHQLTMQDVIYVDEGIEEVSEVYPTQVLPPAAARTGSGNGRASTAATLKHINSSPASSSVVPESCLLSPPSPNSLPRASSLSK
ncbi:uncharacterized protein LOC124708064 [Lolium rigidum]|uniref:uncharacterized protein LOC124708064 n=1 Tax=Lolium rigidum TaxID=89674 RepID=UPI001F5C22EC|nr:uncharacterized protein LOC124708064 [Lolium rigidum]